jgi:hypothetical protein
MAKADLPDVLSGIFLPEGLDRFLLICPSGRLPVGFVGDKALGSPVAQNEGRKRTHERFAGERVASPARLRLADRLNEFCKTVEASGSSSERNSIEV